MPRVRESLSWEVISSGDDEYKHWNTQEEDPKSANREFIEVKSHRNILQMVGVYARHFMSYGCICPACSDY